MWSSEIWGPDNLAALIGTGCRLTQSPPSITHWLWIIANKIIRALSVRKSFTLKTVRYWTAVMVWHNLKYEVHQEFDLPRSDKMEEQNFNSEALLFHLVKLWQKAFLIAPRMPQPVNNQSASFQLWWKLEATAARWKTGSDGEPSWCLVH